MDTTLPLPHVFSRATQVTISPLTGFASSSLDPLPKEIRDGMIAMGLIGLISTASTLGLLFFITYRMIFWRKYYSSPIATNQIFLLVYNLLLADLQQALSFLFAWHWIREGRLVGPSAVCFAQAWLIQIGDVASGLWVLAIAAHTFINLVARRKIPMQVFIACAVMIWLLCFLLSIVGPAMNKDYFVPAGAWCWVSENYEGERLYLHYLWIFIAQLGSLGIYTTIFFVLRTSLSPESFPGAVTSSTHESNPIYLMSNVTTTTVITTQTPQQNFQQSKRRILRAAKLMVVYPFVYVVLTLPLAVGRVSAMAGKQPPLVFFCVAGSLIASTGFVDVILFITTRKALVRSSVGHKRVKTGRKVSRSGIKSSLWGNTSKEPSDLRMDELGPVVDEVQKGSIVVSKSITRREDSEVSFEAEHSGGDTTPGRSESIKSLVSTGRR